MDEELTLEQRTYEFIGRLAKGLYHEGIKVKFSTLIQLLKEFDLKAYGSGRAMASGVRGACHYWEEREKDMQPDSNGHKTGNKIALTFVDKNGEYGWDKE